MTVFLILWVCLFLVFLGGWGRVPPQTLLKMSGFALCFSLFIGISMVFITIVSGQIFPFLYHAVKSIQNTYVLGGEGKLCFWKGFVPCN